MDGRWECLIGLSGTGKFKPLAHILALAHIVPTSGIVTWSQSNPITLNDFSYMKVCECEYDTFTFTYLTQAYKQMRPYNTRPSRDFIHPFDDDSDTQISQNTGI